MIFLYSKPNCPPCMATKYHMDRIGLEYQERDAIEHAEELKRIGFKQAPVVIAGDDAWAGYQPEKIEGLKHGD